VVAGKQPPGAAQAGLNLVGQHQHVMLGADVAHGAQVAGRRHDDAPSPWSGSKRKAAVLGVMAARRASASP